ncbi:4309_t:CDS:2, partial [Racocetra persica]
ATLIYVYDEVLSFDLLSMDRETNLENTLMLTTYLRETVCASGMWIQLLLNRQPTVFNYDLKASLPRLPNKANVKADFCGCTSKQFSNALSEFSDLIGRVKIEHHNDDDYETTISFRMTCKPLLSHLQRLSFHESKINIPTKLSNLSLAKCKNISSNAISSLISKCFQLETLNLYNGRNINTSIKEYDLITILRSPSAKNFQILDIGSSQTCKELHANTLRFYNRTRFQFKQLQ